MRSHRSASHAGCGHQLASPPTGPSAGWSPMPDALSRANGTVRLPWKHAPGRWPRQRDLIRPRQGGEPEPLCPDPLPHTPTQHPSQMPSYSHRCPTWALELSPRMTMSSWKTPQRCLRHRQPTLPQRCLRHRRYTIPRRCPWHQRYTLLQRCLRHHQ